MTSYRYKGLPGKHHALQDGARLTLVPGDIVDLSDTEALAFRDSFEPVDTPPAADPAEPPKAEPKKAAAPAAGGGAAKK
jgi:hypothetical protein